MDKRLQSLEGHVREESRLLPRTAEVLETALRPVDGI